MGNIRERLEAHGVSRPRAERLERVLKRMAKVDDGDVQFFARLVNAQTPEGFERFMSKYWAGTELRAAAEEVETEGGLTAAGAMLAEVRDVLVGLADEFPFMCDSQTCECGENGNGFDDTGKPCIHIRTYRLLVKLKGGE